MKKIALLCVLALTMAMGVAHGGSAFSNAKADFDPAVAGLVLTPDADGDAIINYVKGSDAWNVRGKATDLMPDTHYKVFVATFGVGSSAVEIAEFTTDADGNGRFHENHVEDLPDTYNLVAVRAAPWNPPDTHMRACEEGSGCTEGDLQFRGEDRGQG